MGLLSIQDPTLFFLVAISLVFALSVHEASHAIVAYLCGDETAYRMGRLTLNPLKHLDPIGSLMILFIGFGYAKPVPVNPYNLTNRRIDMIKVAAAGPISNFILSFLAIFAFVLCVKLSILPTGVDVSEGRYFENMKNMNLFIFFIYFITINTYLGLFNLLPIYPLDGGQIFGNFIVKYNPTFFKQLNVYGPKILIGMILLSLLTQGKISFIRWLIEIPAKFLIKFFTAVSDTLLFFL